MSWILFVVLLGPLVYLWMSNRDEKREHAARLKRIQRRLAQKKKASSPPAGQEEQRD